MSGHFDYALVLFVSVVCPCAASLEAFKENITEKDKGALAHPPSSRIRRARGVVFFSSDFFTQTLINMRGEL